MDKGNDLSVLMRLSYVDKETSSVAINEENYFDDLNRLKKIYTTIQKTEKSVSTSDSSPLTNLDIAWIKLGRNSITTKDFAYALYEELLRQDDMFERPPLFSDVPPLPLPDKILLEK